MNANLRRLASAASFLALVVAPALASGAAVQNGDLARGTSLFKLHCAACHGVDGRGAGPLAPQLGSPAPTDLRDLAFLLQRSDADLHKAIAQGGRALKGSFTMPAFASQLAPLDVWDLVAFVREGQPSVAEYFPAAARFTAKTYAFDGDSVRRLETALGKLAADESKIVLVTAFSGEKTAGDEPAYVPHDPRLLDALKPKQKLGYLAFPSVNLPGVGPVVVGLALDKEGALTAVKPRLEALSDKDRALAQKLLAGFEGQGGKRSPYQELKVPSAVPAKGKKAPAKKVEEPKDFAEAAKALSRGYLRAVEAAVQFDKEERDRHWAD